MAHNNTATITSGEMLIVDPCYIAQDCSLSPDELKKAQKKLDEAGTGYLQELDGLLIRTAGNGKFTPEVETEGNRVAKVTFNFVGRSPKGSELTLGECGVDSGQMLFVDPRRVAANPFNYDELCLTWEKHGWDTTSFGFEQGVISSTGWGDGCYEVTGIVNADQLVEAVTITFMAEHCEECGEECEIYGDGMCEDCCRANEDEELECRYCGETIDSSKSYDQICDDCEAEQKDDEG